MLHTSVQAEANIVQSTQATPAAPVTLDINQLYRDHYQHLCRFVQRYLRNPDDVDDVVQSAFYEALRCADRFAGMSKPSTWLFGIALNLARNQVRRNCATSNEVLDESVLEQLLDECSDPADIIEQRQIAVLADSMLDQFPAAVRSTFEAVLEGDCTYEQAAQQLGIPVGTVRSRVSRVRASIRAKIG